MVCQLKTANRTCSAKFVKATGIFTVGKYFCTEACIDADDDVKRFNEMEAQSKRLEAELGDDGSDEGEIDL